jgi:hypothetical protein
MKPVAMFVLGAVLAAGMVYFVMNGDKAVEPAPVAAVQQPVPPQQAAETPEVNPEAAPPPAIEPARRPSPVPTQRSERRQQRTVRQNAPVRVEQPVATAQNTPPPPEPVVQPVAPTPEPAPQPAAEVPQKAVEGPQPEPRVPKTVTIPSGTLLSVRLDEALSSDRNQQGDSFRATLDQPLVVDGFVIAERGARVEGRVAEVDEGGRVRGVSSMALELVRMTTSDGQRIKLQTATFAKQGEQSRKKDIAKIGAAAGIGAAIGAIAGGGKGAAIGAAAGGAAGTGGVMATRGEAAQLPAETRLSFRLNQPITITEKL